MNKTLILHSCWAIAALAAFGLGSRSGSSSASATQWLG